MNNYTHQIEPVIEPDRENGELGTFNPTACFDEAGRLQVLYRSANIQRLTRLARAVFDGEHFVRQKPITITVKTGDPKTDAFVTHALANSEEDPRLVRLPGEKGWYITIVGLRLLPYTEGQKAITVLARISDDFERYEVTRLLTPGEFDDRHVIPFPERLRDRYALLSRPQLPGKDTYVDYYSGGPSCVYLSLTPDLGIRPDDRPLLRSRHPWEARRIGGVGPQPVLTSKGWLIIYMAIDMKNRYSVGAALLEIHSLEVTARTPQPLLTPDDAFNRHFKVIDFGLENVIFATTALVDEPHNTVTFLVGCNDIKVGKVVIPLTEIFGRMVSP